MAARSLSDIGEVPEKYERDARPNAAPVALMPLTEATGSLLIRRQNVGDGGKRRIGKRG